MVRAKQLQRLPVVLTRGEVAAVLRHLSGTPWSMATLLYGAGLRLMACIRLRVQDSDVAYCNVTFISSCCCGLVRLAPEPH